MNKNKKKLFTKVSCAQKDSCFLLADDSVAFVKEKRADGSFECDVIRPQYMDSVYKRLLDSKVFGIVLLRQLHRSKRRVLTKAEFSGKCVCLPERRGLAVFPMLHQIERC